MKHKSYKVIFCYRVYSRTHQGDQLNEIQDKVTERYPEVVFTEGKNSFWVADPSKIDALRERGILLTDFNDELCVVVQEVQGIIHAMDYSHGEEIVADLLNTYPKTFATLAVQAEWLTEIPAL